MIRANLQLLRLEYFLRMREDDKIVWKTINGDLISIKKMSDQHLINTINMLESREEKEREELEALSSIGDIDF